MMISVAKICGMKLLGKPEYLVKILSQYHFITDIGSKSFIKNQNCTFRA